VSLSCYVWSECGRNWVEFETLTTFPKVSATVEIFVFVPAINHGFRVVNLLVSFISGPFEKTSLWTPKLPVMFLSVFSPPTTADNIIVGS
jgi:hypothetical protein